MITNTHMPKDYQEVERIVEEICYEGAKIGSPVPLEVYQAIKKALTTYGNARELEGVEKVKSKKKRILVVSDSGEVVPLDVILLRDLQSLEVKQELK